MKLSLPQLMDTLHSITMYHSMTTAFGGSSGPTAGPFWAAWKVPACVSFQLRRHVVLCQRLKATVLRSAEGPKRVGVTEPKARGVGWPPSY